MVFKKAVKYGAKLRLALAGPAGSGKTWTALTIAKGLADGGSIAVIDTEHGSASKYADDFVFDVLEMTNFDPRNYIKAIHEAEQAGYAVLIIDSLSHAWNGTGGALELVDATAKKNLKNEAPKPNTFNAWGEVTPIQNKMIDAILGSKIHIICTMRTKQEYIVNGNAPRKLGMAPIQRADIEYEFDIYADMDIDNTMIIQKSRCRPLSGKVIPKPGAKVVEILATWLKGAPIPIVTAPPAADAPPVVIVPVPVQQQEADMPISEQQLGSIRKLCEHLGKPEPENLTSMKFLEARKVIQQLTTEYKEARQKSVPTTNNTQEITVAFIKKRLAQVRVIVNSKPLTFPEFYEGVAKKTFESDDAISPEECQQMNRRLDAVVQGRQNVRTAEAQPA